MKNLFSKRGFVLLATVLFLIGGFFVANTALAAALTYSHVPSGNLTASVKANFVVQAPDTVGYDVSLSDGGAGGVFYGGAISGYTCNNTTPLTTITIASGDTQKAFCYSNATPGTYIITISASSLDSVSTSVTVIDPNVANVATLTELNTALADSSKTTINVAAGTYTGNFTIDRSLSLVGVGDTTIIDGTIYATGANVTIQNLKITNPNPDGPYDWGVKATAGKTLTLETVTIDVTHNGVYMKSKDLTNATTINISDSNITGYAAIELADPDSTSADNNAAISVNISGTSLTGTTSYGSGTNDYSTIGIDYTNNVTINFTETNSVANEYTEGATSKERLIWFYYSGSSSVTGTPTYTNHANSTVNNDALFMSSVGYTNTVAGQVVARYVTDSIEFETALAEVVTTPIVVGSDYGAFGTTKNNTLNTGTTLKIEASSPVTINTGHTLTNNGKIQLEPGATLTVASGGTISGSGTIELCVNTGGTVGCFSSIQTAINAAPSGATVNVVAGEYTEQIIINKNLTLQGAGRDSTKILSPASLTATGTGKKGILAVVSPDPANPITVDISDITVDGHAVAVEKMVGVHFFAANGSLSDSRVTGMRDLTLGSQERWGVFTNHTWDTLVSTHVTVSDNIIDNYQKAGIVASEWGSTMTATGNTVTGAGDTDKIAQNGIESNYGASATISGNNIVSGHNYIGLADDYAAGILVVGNHLTGNSAQPSTSISNNTVSDNEVGVAISTDTFYGYGDALSTINNNSITGNLTGVKNDNLSGTLDATQNWWGDATGPYHSTNLTGLGNSVSDHITFTPWYIDYDPMTTTNEDVATLADAKVTAKADVASALSGYSVENYTEANWTTLNAFHTNGDIAIDAATSVDDVTTAQTTATTSMAGVQTIAQTLAAAKTTAHTALTSALASYTEGNYSGANWITLTGFKTTGDTAIDAAGNTGAITSAQNTATTGMAGVETIAIATALAEAKSAEAALTSTNYLSYSAVTTALALPETNNSEKITKTNALNGAVSGLVRVDTLFDSISSTLTTAGIANNLDTITGQNWTSFSGAYFEKSVNGIKRGKITFSSALDFSNSDTRDFLQALGTKMDMAAAGTIGLDFRGTTDSVSLKGVSATIEFYGLDSLGFTTSSTSDDVNSKLVAYDDNGNVLNKSDLVSTPGTYTPPVGACEVGGACYIFAVNVSHFTKYKVLETTVTAQTAPDESGDATVNSDTPEVVITNQTQAVDVTISSGTTDAKVDVSSFVSTATVDGETMETGDIPQITITSTAGSGNAAAATIEIPATTVTGPSDWDGVIAAPTTKTVDLPVTSGQTKTFSTGIELGFATAKLSFDEAVKILLPGQAGKRAGYVRPGTDFTEITTTCGENSQTWANANLGADGECKIYAGSDMVIWTKHFTTFATYTQTTNSTSGGGGGGGRPQISTLAPVLALTAPIGQVLGASTGPIAGCDNRTTGFSITTGESCVGNTGTISHFNFTKFLKNNSKGDEVIALQNFLTALGYNLGTVDGKFGPKTKAAVIKFQIANKLKGDGIIGALTRAVLNK